MSAILEAHQVTVVPPGEQAATLRMLSFRLEEGQALGVIGPSGAGKSTLARAITGVWRPAGGKIRLDGRALKDGETLNPTEAVVLDIEGVGTVTIAPGRSEGLAEDEADLAAHATFEGVAHLLLEEDVAESTQTIFESRRKNEWLEARVQDLLDVAQLHSGDTQETWRRLEQVIRRLKADALGKGYHVGLGDIDQPD